MQWALKGLVFDFKLNQEQKLWRKLNEQIVLTCGHYPSSSCMQLTKELLFHMNQGFSRAWLNEKYNLIHTGFIFELRNKVKVITKIIPFEYSTFFFVFLNTKDEHRVRQNIPLYCLSVFETMCQVS